MQKKIHPKNRRKLQKQQFNNASTVSINPQYLNELQNSKKTTIQSITYCEYCKKTGVSTIIPICQCDDKLFHQLCFSYWLSSELKSKEMSVRQQDNYKAIQCKICGYQVRFKAQITWKCSNCKQIREYTSQNPGFFVGILISFLLLLGSVITFLLILLGILNFKDLQIQRSAVLIGSGIIVFIMLSICMFCSLSCLRSHSVEIDTLYDRNGRAHRGGNLYRRNKSRKEKRSRLNIQNIE